MSTKIGHFEILTELSKSATGTIYKANDPQTSQTVALKAIQLSAFGDQAAELQKCLLAEAETIKAVSHSNIPPIYGAGEIDGQFCAAMEYIQGNSIATMLARKEGFSIWDLLDIGRQVCSGFDAAHSHHAYHFSLEPAKIMCGWDGGVRILGYGISGIGKFTLQIPGVPPFLYYMSPEQVRGEEIDGRSNLYTLGAIFYEMVTDQKPFDCEDSETLRQMIAESAPTAPIELNPKTHPGLSQLILKALAKDPAERYQNGRELLDDLENCKESKPQAAKAAPQKSTVVIPDAVKAANQAKLTGSPAPKTAVPTPRVPSVPVPRPPAAKTAVAQTGAPAAPQAPKPSATPSRSGAAAAAAPARVKTPAAPPKPTFSAPPAVENEIEIESPQFEAPAPSAPQAKAPKLAVDPMMAEGGPAAGNSVSFSDMTELPPLKESYTEPTPAPEEAAPAEQAPPRASKQAATMFQMEMEAEKPKVQPREIAEKAVKEIKNVPPRLIIYAIAGAAVLILCIAVALVMHIQSLNTDGDTRPVAVEQPQAAPAKAAQSPAPVQAQPAPAVAADEPAETAEPEVQPVTRTAAPARGRNARHKTVEAAPAIVPGMLAVDSTPQGAQVQIDGRTDPSWVTPLTLSGMAVGQHSIVVSKAGYATDSRSVDVASGSKAFVSSRLSQLSATLSVSSNPAGANIYIDGKDTGKVTPAQVAVPNAGAHLVLVRKSGYIDETTNAQFALGQTVSFTPALRALGNVDDIKTTGKMNKLFRGKDAQNMGTVSIKTSPKGAEVAINQHMLDKSSPVEVLLDPGNYIVDITASGYQPIHKVISVDKGGKVVIDEVMQRE